MGVGTSIVVPAFDEADRLPRTLDRLVDGLDAVLGTSWEVVVSDDGSTDATAQIVRSAAAREPRVRLCRHEHNRGKGAALAAGAAAAHLDLVAFLDADLPVSLDEVRRMVDLAISAEVVLGSRRLPGSSFSSPQPVVRRLGGRAFLAGICVLGYSPSTDPQCGVKVFHRSALLPLLEEVTGTGFSFDVELIERARRSGLGIVEHPVEWTHVPGSSVRPVRDALITWRDLWRLRRRLPETRRERATGLAARA